MGQNWKPHYIFYRLLQSFSTEAVQLVATSVYYIVFLQMISIITRSAEVATKMSIVFADLIILYDWASICSKVKTIKDL